MLQERSRAVQRGAVERNLNAFEADQHSSDRVSAPIFLLLFASKFGIEERAPNL